MYDRLVHRPLKRTLDLLDGAARRNALDRRNGLAGAQWSVVSVFGEATGRVETARHLAGEGRFDDAFALLLAEIRSGGALRDPAVLEYQRFAMWLAKAGYLVEMQRHLKALRDVGVPEADEFLIDIWAQRAVLDPANTDFIREFLEKKRKDSVEGQALWLLFMIGEEPERLKALYAKVRARGNDKILNDYIGVLSRIDPALCLDTIRQNAKALKANTLPLGADLVLQRNAGAVPGFPGKRAKAFADRFVADCLWLRDILSDVTKRIAVVGNSSVETGLGKGQDIDGHDLVIRFNLPAVPKDAQPDYGSKTDLLVCNYSELRKLVGRVSLPLIVTGKDWEAFTGQKGVAFQISEQGGRIATPPYEVRQRLNKAFRGTASSGIQILAMLADWRGGLKNVDTYGFSMVDQIGANPSSSNYFRVSRPSANHNWKGEAKLLSALRQGDAIETVLDDVAQSRYHNQWMTYDTIKPVRIRLEGDHSHYHCGSAAVTRSLLHHLAPVGVVVEDGDYDVVVMNGEGTMHSGGVGFHRKMKVLGSAVDAGKAAYLVNSVWQDNPNDYDEVLRRLKAIHVREVLSRDDLAKRHGISARVFPDLSYLAPLKAPVNMIDHKDSIVLTDFYSKEFTAFVKLTRAEALKYPFVDMMAMTWDDLVATLKTSKLLITGRHHAVYAACRAEIPFVVFGGNTHKIEGIFKSANVEIPLCPSRAEIPKMIAWARKNRAVYTELFNWMKSHKNWSL
ncbi:polysaccharide pyruvyl transferase family protein [Rhizobium sp. FKL33]|uniref:polysaccharide pyruvyl transferase family protein n=1 Tax=Rhizobium sp. FKL33 TaxID=2562307 RepID=UPI0010BFCA99|nr:polysaccharide pyruvyl transferase family protein [Rhizobium sp. FKL33]